MQLTAVRLLSMYISIWFHKFHTFYMPLLYPISCFVSLSQIKSHCQGYIWGRKLWATSGKDSFYFIIILSLNLFRISLRTQVQVLSSHPPLSNSLILLIYKAHTFCLLFTASIWKYYKVNAISLSEYRIHPVPHQVCSLIHCAMGIGIWVIMICELKWCLF